MVEDGSCIIGGCIDSLSSAFSPIATYDDGSCPPIFRGCTNPEASNYRSIANLDDGSCTIAGCMQSNALNYNSQADIAGRCCGARAVTPAHAACLCECVCLVTACSRDCVCY